MFDYRFREDGVKVDKKGRPLGRNGQPVLQGAILGALPPRGPVAQAAKKLGGVANKGMKALGVKKKIK